jgi:hypothetical protein
MTRHEVLTKFQQRNLDVLRCTIFGRAVGEQLCYAAEISLLGGFRTYPYL